MTDDLPRAYTISESLKLLNVSRAHLYSMKRKGHLAFIKFGGKIMITHEELKRLLTQGTGNTEAPEPRADAEV